MNLEISDKDIKEFKSPIDGFTRFFKNMFGIDLGYSPKPITVQNNASTAYNPRTLQVLPSDQNSTATWIKDLIRELPIKSISIIELENNQSQRIYQDIDRKLVETKNIQKRSYNGGLKRAKRAIGLFRFLDY